MLVLYWKIYYPIREFYIKLHAKNRYRFEIYRGIHESGYLFSLNRIAFVLNERKPRFSYVCVNVGIFNVRSRKAIPVESTVKTVRSPARIGFNLGRDPFNQNFRKISV